MSTQNDFVAQEASLEAQYMQNQNSYASYFNKVKEIAQVQKTYTNDLERLYKDAISARYGNEGTKALVEFIQENNPNLDASMYKQLMQVIEAGRNDFAADQKMLLDQRRVYVTELNSFPSSAIAKFLGFPRIDLKKFDPVTNAETKEAFSTKSARPIDIYH